MLPLKNSLIPEPAARSGGAIADNGSGSWRDRARGHKTPGHGQKRVEAFRQLDQPAAAPRYLETISLYLPESWSSFSEAFMTSRSAGLALGITNP